MWPPGCRFLENWQGGDSCGYYGDNTHGHFSYFHSQAWWHPGHEVLCPNLPQQHRVFRWSCLLCLLLSGQPVQPQCCLRSDQQPWGYMGQRLYQPTVGASSICLMRAWVAFPYHRRSVCSLGSILPPSSPGCYSLSALTPRHIQSSLLTQKGSKDTCPKGSCPRAQLLPQEILQQGTGTHLPKTLTSMKPQPFIESWECLATSRRKS